MFWRAHLDRSDVIGGNKPELTFSINNMPPVSLLSGRLLKVEEFALTEAEGLRERCFEVE